MIDSRDFLAAKRRAEIEPLLPAGPKIAFKPDWTKHAKAGPFKRNDQMLKAMPIGVMRFPGAGTQNNLADKAKTFSILVWRFGGGGLEPRWLLWQPVVSRKITPHAGLRYTARIVAISILKAVLQICSNLPSN